MLNPSTKLDTKITVKSNHSTKEVEVEIHVVPEGTRRSIYLPLSAARGLAHQLVIAADAINEASTAPGKSS